MVSLVTKTPPTLQSGAVDIVDSAILTGNFAKSGPDILSTERRAQLVATLGDSASYCRIFENIWIGDIGTAAAAASGRVVQFGAVFNASGRESRGLSFAREYRARGVHYLSMREDSTAMTLADSKGTQTARQVAETMVETSDIVPGALYELADGTAEKAHTTQTSTDAAFAHFMYEANRKIAALTAAAEPAPQVLVHCYAGVNRSASAIVAYAMLSRGWKYADIERLVIEQVRVRRRMAALTNSRFRKLLVDHIAPGGAESAAGAYRREHDRILTTATTLARERVTTKAAVRQEKLYAMSVGAEYDQDDVSCAVSAELALTLAISQSGTRGYVCVHCGTADVQRMMYCARCGPERPHGFYCSRDCQIADYVNGNHAAVCERSNITNTNK